MSESASLAHIMLVSIHFTNAWSIYYKSMVVMLYRNVLQKSKVPMQTMIVNEQCRLNNIM